MNVIGVHFVCPRELHVTRLPDGTVETGNWLVASQHLPHVRYLALHEARKNLSYLQGDVIGHREAEEAGRVIFLIKETPQPFSWPARTGAGERAYAYDAPGVGETLASGLMYECEVRALFVRDGKKVLEWTVKPVSALGSGAQRGIRCMHCAGAVRVHKQRVAHGPADHVEHLRKVDSQNCRGGHHFGGSHKRSDQPVE